MRDIALLIIFTVVLVHAFRKTWVAVMLWTWVSIMNPHKLAWGFAVNMPFAAAAAIAAFASIPLNKHKLHFPRHAASTALILFIVWCCLTTLFAIYPFDSATQLKKVIKIQVMTLIALAAIRERKHIEMFVWINALSIGFYGVKGGVFTIMSGGGGRVWGPAGGFIAGNNEIGLAIIMVIPLLNFLRAVSTNFWVRQALLVSMLLSAAAALGTQSRGAFLAIAAMAVVMWMRSQRKALGAIVFVVASVMLVAFMPASWEERMRSIQTYQEDGSAMGRINAWWMAFNLANDRFMGGGFEIITPYLFARYAPVPHDIHAQHSIYFQVLGEHGWIGLVLFCSIGFFAFREAQRLRKAAAKIPEAKWVHELAGMVQVSMTGFAVGGAFLSLAYFDLPYNMMVIVVALAYWMREQRWQTETAALFDRKPAPPREVPSLTPKPRT